MQETPCETESTPTTTPSSSATDRRATPSFTRSTATPTQTIEWEDGNTYPVLDSEGRVEKFNRRYGRKSGQAAAEQNFGGAR